MRRQTELREEVSCTQRSAEHEESADLFTVLLHSVFFC